MKKIKNLKRPYVFVPMAVDCFHHGHLNILLKAKSYGKVIVGLMTDNGIKSYKKHPPLIKYNNRKKILENLKCVDFIIPLKNINFSEIALKYKFNYIVHGSDWKKGVQSKERIKLLKKIKDWNGKIIDVNYTKDISSIKIKKYYKSIKT